LIGLVLVRDEDGRRVAGKIVETEAYVLRDPASHAYRGKSRRNASMFLAPFHAYIYKIYGTSFCFNVSGEDEAVGAAVLVRALEPIDGIATMVQRRGTQAVRDLCRGPGRLCAALAMDRRLDGIDLLRSRELWLADAGFAGLRIGKSKRIGIVKAANRHLRFYEIGSPFISGPRRLSP
jgi:DNA-3-methyladenine glycosylase